MAATDPCDLRCECGSLMARVTAAGVELKCRRCKRLVYIPVDDLPGRYEQNRNARREPRHEPHPADNRGQYCTVCGQYKPSVLYGKCLDCRTQSIKVQYKSTLR